MSLSQLHYTAVHMCILSYWCILCEKWKYVAVIAFILGP